MGAGGGAAHAGARTKASAAAAAFRDERWQEAADAYSRLTESAGRRVDPKERRRWALRLSQAQLKLSQFDEAIEGLSSLRKSTSEDSSMRPFLDSLLGWAHWQNGDRKAAITALSSARSAWSLARAGDRDALDRVTLQQQHAHVDRLLQRLLMDDGDAEAAFAIAEQARSQALLALLGPEEREASEAGGATELWSAKRVQALARDLDTTLVAYSVVGREERIVGDELTDERELLIWVVAADAFAARRVRLPADPVAPLSDLAARLRPLILDKEGDESLDLLLAELHELLIEPIADLLPGGDGASLTVLPAGPLYLVPFAALVDATAGRQHLVQRFALRYGLSASQLQRSLNRGRTLRLASSAESLIVGNPLAPTAGPGLRRPPAPLPGAEREARAIASLLGAEAWIGEAATHPRVLKALNGAPLIHFATHGLLGLDPHLDDLGRAEEDAPSARQKGVLVTPGAVVIGKGVRIGGSSAAVALAREKVVRVPLAGALLLAGDPSFLLSGEIAGLDLSAGLVVLSACGTARGRITEEGSIGLTWAFLSAGAPAVVSSLWSVPDAPTAELMVQLYRRLQAGTSAPDALRQAMLATAEDHPHPRDWAAFVVTGLSAWRSVFTEEAR